MEYGRFVIMGYFLRCGRADYRRFVEEEDVGTAPCQLERDERFSDHGCIIASPLMPPDGLFVEKWMGYRDMDVLRRLYRYGVSLLGCKGGALIRYGFIRSIMLLVVAKIA
mmetsp:Transcript_11617/g.28560  ORF Transcript_11617/g.28560 Transcript_11617/m.28560 type:complete len:110 (-) Transcript_11617:65-394(-)